MKKRILVIEDNPVTRMAMRHLIQLLDCDASEAGNGIEGLSVLSRVIPDLIILDIAMPFMNGKEFLTAMKSNPEYENIPVLVLTAYSDKKMVGELMQMGISGYVLKPFEKDKLMLRIRQVLEFKAQSAVQRGAVFVSANERKKLIIADKNEDFRSFAATILCDNFEVFEAKNGAECLQLYMSEHAEILLLGDELGVINEQLLAKKILDIDSNNIPSMFYCTSKDANEIPEDLFQGIIAKTSRPDEFLLSFCKTVLGINTVFDMLRATIRNMKQDLALIVKLTMQSSIATDLVELPDAEARALPVEMYAVADAIELSEHWKISFFLMGNQKDLIQLTQKSASGEMTLDKGAIDVLGENIKTIAAKMSAQLKHKGFTMAVQDVRVKVASEDMRNLSNELLVGFQTPHRQSFICSVSIRGVIG